MVPSIIGNNEEKYIKVDVYTFMGRNFVVFYPKVLKYWDTRNH